VHIARRIDAGEMTLKLPSERALANQSWLSRSEAATITTLRTTRHSSAIPLPGSAQRWMV
jgi:hypothetical protein